jgi:hypothetical protein
MAFHTLLDVILMLYPDPFLAVQLHLAVSGVSEECYTSCIAQHSQCTTRIASLSMLLTEIASGGKSFLLNLSCSTNHISSSHFYIAFDVAQSVTGVSLRDFHISTTWLTVSKEHDRRRLTQASPSHDVSVSLRRAHVPLHLRNTPPLPPEPGAMHNARSGCVPTAGALRHVSPPLPTPAATQVAHQPVSTTLLQAHVEQPTLNCCQIGQQNY